MAGRKWYVVWHGHRSGVFDSWAECQEQIKGFAGAKYKSFTDRRTAYEAYEDGYEGYYRQHNASRATGSSAADVSNRGVVLNSYSVDAACSGNPGMMEYRGVFTSSKTQLFHFGPIWGTNNIGEFLAIVHCLALQVKQGTNIPIYSDSVNAMKWVKNGVCKTKLPIDEKSSEVYQMIRRAEYWLANNRYDHILIMKWNTKEWGEIPADFGRKK